MSGIVFEKMDKKKRALYECMWGSSEFDFPVEKTKLGSSVSDNSYTFAGTSHTDADICRTGLAELFGIKNRELFKEKFAQSIGGNGRELKRIARLHSSSLCALMFFYNVSAENPYIMSIEGNEYIFTHSCFEYQNTVIRGGNPSNIDIVLLGKDASSKAPTVLFLESKFSEYYESPANQLNKISSAYLENNYGKSVYTKASLDKMGLYMTRRDGDKNFTLCSEELCYLEGIKQMISHYIGIRNLCDSPRDKNDAVANAVSAGAKILLGEILFTKGISRLHIGSDKECLEAYREKYIPLAEVLNDRLKKDGLNDKFTVLSDVLSYSQFLDKAYIREPQIKRFYFESGK